MALSVVPTTHAYGDFGTTVQVELSSDVGESWTAASDDPRVSAVPSSGTIIALGSNLIDINLDRNLLNQPGSAIVTFTGATNNVTVSTTWTVELGAEGAGILAHLNRLAKTTDLGMAGAANVYAGTSGLETVGALNAKAGTNGLDLQGVCNELAGTAGLGTLEALSKIATPP